MQSELYIAAALYTQRLYDIDRSRTEHLIFFIGQRNCRCQNDGITGMNADRIHIFHAADGDAVALGVADYLKLDLLPARDAFFYQNLRNRGQIQTVGSNLLHLFYIVGNTAAGTAQREGRTNDYRIADLLRKSQAGFQIRYDLRRNTGLSNGNHRILKHLTVFCLVDGLRTRAQKPNAMALQEAFLGQLHGQCQSRLTSQGGQDAVRLLLLNNSLDRLQRQRLDIDVIRHRFIRHDRRGVGVDQNDLQALFLQCPAGLCASVVEFGCLTDYDRAGTNYHYFL